RKKADGDSRGRIARGSTSVSVAAGQPAKEAYAHHPTAARSPTNGIETRAFARMLEARRQVGQAGNRKKSVSGLSSIRAQFKPSRLVRRRHVRRRTTPATRCGE